MAFQLLPDIYVPTFTMTVGGVPLPAPLAKTVMEISVTQLPDLPDSFHFRLNDPTLKLIDAQTGIFTEGARVEISMGFVGNTKTLIVGEISALTADFPDSGPATLEAEGFDFLHRLTRGTFYRRFDGPDPNTGLSDGQIVTQIASEMGLTPEVDDPGPRTAARVQANVRNLDFLKELAKLDNYYLWVDGQTLHFKQARPAPANLTLDWGKTLRSFSPRLTTAGQVNSVQVRGWDPVQKQEFSATADRSDASAASLSATGRAQLALGSGGQSQLTISDPSIATAAEAQAYAEAILSGEQQAMITGHGTSVGQPDMEAGSILVLNGVGRFSGSYVVQQAVHTLGAGGYQTSFEVRAS